jgi:HPt (histidine-containing phosphotransfer) domain-containing protein
MSGSVLPNNLKQDKTAVLSDRINYPLPDLTYLKDMAAGDEAFVNEIITTFLESAGDLLDLMRESGLSGDHEKLKFAAHKLLPQLSFVGILAAVPDVKKIESESKHMDDLSAVIERAIRTINYGIEDLKKMI